MYGLDPNKIDSFTHVCGNEVVQVCVGRFDLQYHLNPMGHISIWGRCELRDTESKLVDVWQGDRRSSGFSAFIDLLGAVVSEVVIDNPSTLRLQFVDGRQLLLFDESPQYESFSVNGIVV